MAANALARAGEFCSSSVTSVSTSFMARTRPSCVSLDLLTSRELAAAWSFKFESSCRRGARKYLQGVDHCFFGIWRANGPSLQ